ncbi:MAG: gliding motility-associated C-terminal domain-containing protein [Bacteroidia bacterium]|nr:gliding motility-associated C-terminal domain-containing protein [Bacteroidia bacterium]
MLCFAAPVSAQNGTWTWMKGTAVTSPVPNFGIQGVSSPTNEPPGVYEAAEWTDLNGNFWVFGGLNFATGGYENSLWRYVPATNEWTWMNGPSASNSIPVYGVQGVPSPNNFPGGRSFAPRTWTDTNGDLWLMGGAGIDATGNSGFLNDLWRYNIATNEWTWMNGPQIGNGLASFGIQGVMAPTNLPPAAQESAASWVDNNGDLWLFSGIDGFLGGADDMWRYSVGSNMWTWMSGQSAGPVVANHGTLQVPSPTNTPGTRWNYSHWTDLQGRFWMFGSLDYNSVGYADMWMYDPSTLLWTWMAGPNTPGLPNTFSTPCVPGGYPDPSVENRICWTDQCGRLWSMGTDFNYLWLFDTNTLQFTYITGSTAQATPLNLGTQGIPAPTNYPMGAAGGNGFVSANGDLWFFGGGDLSGVLGGTINLLWRYQIDPTCPGTAVNAQFTSSPSTSGCAPLSLQFNPSSTSYNSYQWDFGDTTTLADTSNLASPTYLFTQPGTYTVTLIITGTSSCGANADTTTTIITVYPQPVVNLGSDSTICNGLINLTPDAGNAGSNYLWSTGATTQTINVTAPGIYSVTVSSGPNGLCSDQDTLVITQPAQPDLGGDTAICAGQSLLLDPGITGTQYIWSNGATTPTITVSTTGLYSVQIINPPCTASTAMNLSITPLPVVNLGADTTLCPDDSIVLNAQNPGAVYLWSNAATTQTISTSTAGNYAVTVTAQNCSASDTISISTTQNLSLDETVSLCGSFNALTLDAGNPGATYLWSTGDNTQTISIQQPGTYWVNVSAPPCQLTDTIEVTGSIGEAVVYVPNSFTPNGDGLNDRFSGYGESFTSFSLILFNRWGEKIFETNDPAGWDGNYVGQRAESEVYVYLLSYSSACTGGKIVDLRGHVTLIR